MRSLDLIGAVRPFELFLRVLPGCGTEHRPARRRHGPGTLIGPALERGALVSAIDLSPRMVAEAQARHPGVDIVVGDAAGLPHPDRTFDAVTLSFCLHHTADPGAVLAEVHRVLRPGGRVAFAVWAPPVGRVTEHELGFRRKPGKLGAEQFVNAVVDLGTRCATPRARPGQAYRLGADGRRCLLGQTFCHSDGLRRHLRS